MGSCQMFKVNIESILSASRSWLIYNHSRYKHQIKSESEMSIAK